MTSRPSPSALAILGMLSLAPQSGYELSTNVGKSIAHFWPMSKSQVYAALAKLEEEQLVEGTAVVQDHAPDKRTYTLTTEGREVLDDWLASPDYDATRQRSMVLLKVFFGARMAPDTFEQMLDRLRDDAEVTRQTLSEIVTLLDGPPETFYIRATALLGLRSAETTIAWVDEIRRTRPRPRREPMPERAYAAAARELLDAAPLKPTRRKR